MLISEKEVTVAGHKFWICNDARSCAKNSILSGQAVAEPKDPKFLLDLGANIGIWSFLMAKRFPAARILAIEPLSVNVEAMSLGIKKNALTNISLIRAAIGADTIRWHPVNNEATSAHLPEGIGLLEERVENLDLNTVFKTLNCFVDFVKCDIEGSEFEALAGFEHWDKVGGLSIEIHPWPRFKDFELQHKKTMELIELIQDKMGDKPVEILDIAMSPHGFGLADYPDIEKCAQREEELKKAFNV